MSLFFRNVRFRKGLRGNGWATPEYYGAKGEASVNDKPAFDAAIADLTTDGGRLLLGPKQYRLDGLLSVPSNVSIFGVPDVTYVAWNHASANGLVFTSFHSGPPAVVSDIRFIGLVGNTGSCITNNADARVQFVRCSWNGFNSGGAPSNNLQGKILAQNSADSRTYFTDCDIKVVGDVVGLDATDGIVHVTRGSMTMPATYNQNLLRAQNSAKVRMSSVAVDCTQRVTGGGVAVLLADAVGATAEMHDCTLNGTGAVGTIYGLLWIAGTRVAYSNNLLLGNITPFAGNLAAAGSLVDVAATTTFGPSSSTTIDLTSLAGYRTVVARSTAATSPTVTFPPILVAGQKLCFMLRNSSGGPWGFSIAVSPAVVKETQSTVNNGVCITGNFIAADLGSGLVWVQVGPWGYAVE